MSDNKTKRTVNQPEDVEAQCESPEENEIQEIPFSISQSFTYGYDERLQMEDSNFRIFYLTDEVNESVFNSLVYQILHKNKEDDDNNIPVKDRVPIKIFINSPGGTIWDGLALVEAIRVSKTPVYGICIGYALSMAFHVYVACHKRFATRNAFFLNHEGEDYEVGHPSKIKDYMKFADKLESRLDAMIIERTKMTQKQLDDNRRVETYMFADEALELGIVDKLISSFDKIK